MRSPVLLAVLSLIGASAAHAQPPPPKPACAAPEHRQFDFWIGEWDVVFSANGRPAGHSLVERLYGDCVLRENWTGAGGYSGGSLNIYDRASRTWRQTWTGSDGSLTEYGGGLQGRNMVFLARETVEDGQRVVRRMSFIPLPDGAVRQFIEVSKDQGGHWTPEYDLTYRRTKAAP